MIESASPLTGTRKLARGFAKCKETAFAEDAAGDYERDRRDAITAGDKANDVVIKSFD